MAASKDESGVYARMGCFPLGGSLRPRLGASTFLHVTAQSLQFLILQVLDSSFGQLETGRHSRHTLAKTGVHGFARRGGDAVMR